MFTGLQLVTLLV